MQTKKSNIFYFHLPLTKFSISWNYECRQQITGVLKSYDFVTNNDYRHFHITLELLQIPQNIYFIYVQFYLKV